MLERGLQQCSGHQTPKSGRSDPQKDFLGPKEVGRKIVEGCTSRDASLTSRKSKTVNTDSYSALGNKGYTASLLGEPVVPLSATPTVAIIPCMGKPFHVYDGVTGKARRSCDAPPEGDKVV